MSGRKRSRGTERTHAAPTRPRGDSRPAARQLGRWVAIGTAVLVIAIAWVAADRLTRARVANASGQKAFADLPGPASAQLRAAAARAEAEPASADAVGEFGRALHAASLTEDAVGMYAKAEALDSTTTRWAYLRAVLLEERGRADQARAALDAVVTRNGGHGLAWFRLAEIAFKEGRLDDAELAYRRAVDAPAVPPLRVGGVTSRRVISLPAYARLGLARIAIERRKTSEAVSILDAVIAAEPRFGPARTLRLSLAPTQGGPLSASGRAYVPPNDPEIDAIVAMSANRDLLLKHAAVAARGGDREWRELLVRRAAQLNPLDPNVLMELAAMLQDTGRATEALDVLRRHEQLVPADHHTLVEQGRCLSNLGRLGEAEAVLRRAARVRDAAAEYNLGTVLDRLGRSDEARAHYERALAIDPFHARALNNLGVWLDRHGQGADAIRTLERAIQADPENGEAYSNLGSAFIGARRLADALRALDVAIALDPEAPNARNNRGIALAQMGRFQEAIAEWDQTLTLDPNHANARQNLERVKALGR